MTKVAKENDMKKFKGLRHGEIILVPVEALPVSEDQTLLDRLTARILVDENDCWDWTGTITKDGYGKIVIGWKDNHQPIKAFAHRISYSLFKEELQDGLQIDHLCRNRGCVNPEHLEMVTQQENIARGNTGQNLRDKANNRTHCDSGLHAWTPRNIRKNGDGMLCKLCANTRKMQNYYLDKAKKIKLTKGVNSFVVGHSESGHHHVIEGVDFEITETEKHQLFAQLFNPAKIVHKKLTDKHKTLPIPASILKRYHDTEYDNFEEIIREVAD